MFALQRSNRCQHSHTYTHSLWYAHEHTKSRLLIHLERYLVRRNVFFSFPFYCLALPLSFALSRSTRMCFVVRSFKFFPSFSRLIEVRLYNNHLPFADKM